MDSHNNRFDALDLDHKRELIEILRLIIIKDASAIKRLDAFFMDTSIPIDIFLGFAFQRTNDWSNFCECWFELEYFDFITGTKVNETKLKNVLGNILNGICCHVKQNECVGTRETIFYAGIGLIHAATGSGNKAVLRHLLKRSTELTIQKSQSCGLCPPHLALIKSQVKLFTIFSQFRKLYHDRYFYTSIALARIVLAKRLKSTGTVAVTQPYLVFSDILCSIIKVSEDIDEKVITAMLTFGQLHGGYVAQTIIYLLYHNKTNLALKILWNKYTNSLPLDSSVFVANMLVASIVTDAVIVLCALIKRKQNLSVVEFGYNLLDIALAFGSKQCVDVLKHLMYPTAGLFARISPYAFVCYLSVKHCWKLERLYPETIVDLFEKSKLQGHDVNHRDKHHITPLHIAIETMPYSPLVINKLLSLGADVNAKDRNGRTPLFVALTPYNHPCGVQLRGVEKPRGLLKDLLSYNSTPQLTSSAMHYALTIDLRKTSLSIHSSFVILLYELGFKMYKSDRTRLTNSSERPGACSYRGKILGEYMEEVESTPMKLKACCRLNIRKTHPGHTLHTFLEKIHLPKTLREYILFSDLLKYTYIEKDDGIIHCPDLEKGMKENDLLELGNS